MGYFLLYKSMLDSELFARDKFLVANGLIFPDRAVIYIAGIQDSRNLSSIFTSGYASTPST